MKHARPLLALAGCAALIASPAIAQDAASFDATFTVQQGPDGCAIASAPGNPTGVAVAVGETQEGGLWLRASGEGWRFEPGKIYRIRAYPPSETRRPDGPGIEARGIRDATGWGGVAITLDLRTLYSAPALVLYDGSAAIPHADQATAGPADPRPRGLLNSFFTDDDYPSAALRTDTTGVTRSRLTIAPEGRVSVCTVTQSSGNALLDATSCSLARRRARFLPAHDATGAAIEGSFDMTFHWEITGDFQGHLYVTR